MKNKILKHNSGMIYINASWRRKLLEPWVYLCHGDEAKLKRIYQIIQGKINPMWDLEIPDHVDVHHWIKSFEQKRREAVVIFITILLWILSLILIL